jgi:hypothetical protein
MQWGKINLCFEGEEHDELLAPMGKPAGSGLWREAGGPGLAVVGVALVYLSPLPAEY